MGVSILEGSAEREKEASETGWSCSADNLLTPGLISDGSIPGGSSGARPALSPPCPGPGLLQSPLDRDGMCACDAWQQSGPRSVVCAGPHARCRGVNLIITTLPAAPPAPRLAFLQHFPRRATTAATWAQQGRYSPLYRAAGWSGPSPHTETPDWTAPPRPSRGGEI